MSPVTAASSTGTATAAKLEPGPEGIAVDLRGFLSIGRLSETTSSARSSQRRPKSSLSPATALPDTAATTGPRPPPSWTSPSDLPSTPRATCSSPNMGMTSSARSSRQAVTSSPSQATVSQVIAATGGSRPTRSWTIPLALPSMPRATCSWRTSPTTWSARSRRQ